MAEKRRQESQGRFEREGARLLQQSQPRKARVEASTTGGRKPSRLFLRQNDWDEEEIDFREDRERSKQPD